MFGAMERGGDVSRPKRAPASEGGRYKAARKRKEGGVKPPLHGLLGHLKVAATGIGGISGGAAYNLGLKEGVERRL